MNTQPINRNHSGQALLELAIFGSLFLMAFAFLIRVGLRFNFQQEMAMRSFRDGLYDAGIVGKQRDRQVPSVQYTIMEDKQVPQPSDPYGLNPRTRYTGTSVLVWGKHLFQTGAARAEDDQIPNRLVYHVNYRPNGEPLRRAFTDDQFVDPATGRQPGEKVKKEVPETNPARGTLVVHADGSPSRTDAEVTEEIITTWLTNDGNEPGVTNILRQETHR